MFERSILTQRNTNMIKLTFCCKLWVYLLRMTLCGWFWWYSWHKMASREFPPASLDNTRIISHISISQLAPSCHHASPYFSLYTYQRFSCVAWSESELTVSFSLQGSLAVWSFHHRPIDTTPTTTDHSECVSIYYLSVNCFPYNTSCKLFW